MEQIKLRNFGIPPIVRDEKGLPVNGSLCYLSPEQFDGKISIKSDIWAFGCILLFFCTGLRPYYDVSDQVDFLSLMELRRVGPLEYLMQSESSEDEVLNAKIIINQNPVLRCLLFKCFNFNWVGRITSKELMLDKFF